jgi:hypothetical protein
MFELVTTGQPAVPVHSRVRVSRDYLVAALYGLSDACPADLASVEAVRSMVAEVVANFGLIEVGKALEVIEVGQAEDAADANSSNPSALNYSWLAFCQRSVDEAFGFGPALSARPAVSAGPWRRTASALAAGVCL